MLKILRNVALLIGAFWVGFLVAADINSFLFYALVFTFILGMMGGYFVPRQVIRRDDLEQYAYELEREVEHLESVLDTQNRIYERWRSGVENEIGGDINLAKQKRSGAEKWFRIIDEHQICFDIMEWVDILEKRHDSALRKLVKMNGDDTDWDNLENWEQRNGKA